MATPGNVVAASWVDNLVSFAKSACDAIHIVDALALHLKDKWGLQIKTSSREYTTCQGGDRGHESTFAWQHVEHQYLLGHWISHDSGCHFDIAKTSSKAWGAFWANLGHSRAKHLVQHNKIILLNRAVQPIIEFSASRWPPTHSNLQIIGSLQHRMMSLIVKTPVLPEETPAQFRVRRNRSIASTRKVNWRERVKQRSLQWYLHLSRDRNFASPASKLVRFKDALFLETMRKLSRPNSAARGSCTRNNPHAIQPRWEESVLKASKGTTPLPWQ